MKYSFQSKKESIRDVCQELEKFYLDNGVRESDVQDMVLATDEALTNIKKHGYPDGPGDVLLETTIEDSTVCITISDKAQQPYETEITESFDIDTYLGSKQLGGFGLRLMNKLMNEVKVRREDGGNCLTMIKKLNAGSTN